MLGLTLFDALALGLIASLVALYEWLTRFSPWRYGSLSHQIERQRYRWMRAAAARPMRMVDMQIFAGLQGGASFFASTSLLAVGAAFSLFTLSPDALVSLGSLPFTEPAAERLAWSFKVLCLLGLFAAAFLTFAWAFRVFNYSSIVFGALEDRAERDLEELRKDAVFAAELNVQAGKIFNLGMRFMFLSLPFMFWLAGPLSFAMAGLGLFLLLVHRQFFSAARTVLIATERRGSR